MRLDCNYNLKCMRCVAFEGSSNYKFECVIEGVISLWRLLEHQQLVELGCVKMYNLIQIVPPCCNNKNPMKNTQKLHSYKYFRITR